jgi:hypothetical protein
MKRLALRSTKNERELAKRERRDRKIRRKAERRQLQGAYLRQDPRQIVVERQ